MVLALFCLSACSGRGKVEDVPTATESASDFMSVENSDLAEAQGRMALEKKYADFKDDVKVDKDGRVMADSKRSQYEGKTSTVIGGDWGSKEYAAARYSKKEWAGSKDFQSKSYEGETKNRWSESEWFLRKQAEEAGASSRLAQQNYRTENFQTQGAVEQGRVRVIDREGQAAAMEEKNFRPPLIIDKRDYSKMTVEDSKNLLGRDRE